jgi:plastocyanin
MDRRIVGLVAKGQPLFVLAGVTLLGLVLWSGVSLADGDKPTTHTIFLSAVEIKGGTTTDKLAPPSVNPKELSRGYEYKAPGEADQKMPTRWEVSSYLFTPSFVTVRQGDTVKLTAFIVNGDKHEVSVTAPDGRKVVNNTVWQRGREYEIQFVAEKAGTYQLVCHEHAPSMIATFLVLPK